MSLPIIYIFLSLFILSNCQEQTYALLGGVTDVAAEELQQFISKEMTQMAIQKIKQEFKKKYNTDLQIKKYLYGKSQVVAGQIITLGFQTSNGDKYEAAVWLKVWMDFVQLQYLKQITEVANQPTKTDLPNAQDQAPLKVGSQRKDYPLEGGINDVSAEELKTFLTQELTKMAIQKIKEQFQKKYNTNLQIKKYLYGKSQVVAGQIITLGFQTSNGDQYEAAVLLQTWMNIVQLQYLKSIDQVSNNPQKTNLPNVQTQVPLITTAMPFLGASNHPKITYLPNVQTQSPSIIPPALPSQSSKIIQIITNPSNTPFKVSLELPKFFDQNCNQKNHRNCKHLKVGNRKRN